MGIDFLFRYSLAPGSGVKDPLVGGKRLLPEHESKIAIARLDFGQKT
jgi:hypothetical protein